MIKSNKYVLITPARNEEDFIGNTIKSVVMQKMLPMKWVIVSDKSTDRTEDIVKNYSKYHDFMELVRIEKRTIETFASKIKAFELGYNKVRHLDFEYVGNLDADLSFSETYYETMLTKFDQNPRLGIAGGLRFDVVDGSHIREISSHWSVCAGMQLFRRKCYEDIGGYTLVGRMEDFVAEVMARMQDWEVKAFSEEKILHFRPMGTTRGGALLDYFEYGATEYCVGYHPLYELAKCVYRIKQKPYFVSCLLRLSGYLWAVLLRKESIVPSNVAQYVRREQIKRLSSLMKPSRRQSL